MNPDAWLNPQHSILHLSHFPKSLSVSSRSSRDHSSPRLHFSVSQPCPGPAAGVDGASFRSISQALVVFFPYGIMGWYAQSSLLLLWENYLALGSQLH